MKYNCELVQDLYVIYEEGDISENTKKDIEDHLKECDTCRNTYESEDGFEGNLLDTVKETPSNQVDEGLFLKLKIKRFKIGIAIGLIIIIFITSNVAISTYFNSSYDKYIYERKI